MYEMSARNSPVNALVSSTEYLVRALPFSQVKSARANGDGAGLAESFGTGAWATACEDIETNPTPAAIMRLTTRIPATWCFTLSPIGYARHRRDRARYPVQGSTSGRLLAVHR